MVLERKVQKRYETIYPFGTCNYWNANLELNRHLIEQAQTYLNNKKNDE